MKTQISRNAYRREKRYSGVYQQQGRVITDSDWNELVDTLKERVDEALVDVVGSGSPKGRAAGLLMAGTALKITPGVIYAGGIEGRIVQPPNLSSPFDYSQQADFPAPPPLPAAGTAYRVYADVWERHVGPLEDDGLRDPALHGADTCTRTQTLVQVKWCPAAKNPESPSENPVQGDARLTLKYPQGGSQTGGDPCDPKAQEVDPVGGDFLFRAEIHDVRWPGNAVPSTPDRVVIKWSRENGAEQYTFADMPDWFKTGPWFYEMYDADSERHLGFHLATTSWTPKRGTLVAALPQIAPAGTMVRRWDGYLVLVRTGFAWAVSTASGETAEDTAGGADVTWNDGVMTVALGDFDLSLQVVNKTFLPGDFWTAPVRRATYEAGKALLNAAPPSGIVHRYVTLGEVQANNQLKVRTAQEQRKLAFPRLSELDAGDMGYSTTCTSGLFDNNHDTVKKALDRLCAINGTHVGYTKPSDTSVFRGHNPATVAQALNLLADVQSDDIGYVTSCTSGLYDGTHDTVKKALDRLCAINATHVGFTKPADPKSIYEGANPTTVAQALELLNDVKSQQISYANAQNPAVDDVKEALDELYARPVQNGTRVYVGDGGQYASLDLAVNDLLAQGKKDIAIALMPGVSKVVAAWNPGNLAGVRLNILGLGAAARLETQGVTFDNAESVQIQQVNWIINNSTLSFNRCGEVILTGNVFEGSILFNKALIALDMVRRVVIEGNVIDSQWEVVDPFVVNILGLNAFENVEDLLWDSLGDFKGRVRTLAQTLFNLPAVNRTSLGNGILSRTANVNSLHFDERNTYQAIGNLLITPVSQQNFLERFPELMETQRHILYVKNPGTSIQYGFFMGPTTIRNNHISGLLGLGGLPKSNVNLYNLGPSFISWRQINGMLTTSHNRHIMQVTGNVMAGMRFGEQLMNTIRTGVLNHTNVVLSGLFRTLQLSNNVIENEDNYVLADEVDLLSNQFTFYPLLQTVALWVIASGATYVSNRTRVLFAALYDGTPTPSSDSFESGNYRINVISGN